MKQLQIMSPVKEWKLKYKRKLEIAETLSNFLEKIKALILVWKDETQKNKFWNTNSFFRFRLVSFGRASLKPFFGPITNDNRVPRTDDAPK